MASASSRAAPSRPRGSASVMKTLRLAHAWTGLVISLLLVAIALSGTLLIFAPDLARITTPGAQQPPPLRGRGQLAGVMAEGRALSPGGFQGVRFASRTFGLDEVMMKQGGAYIDPRTGAVVRVWRGERWSDVVFDVHRHLLLKGLGTTIVGWTGAAALLLTLSGLVLWWPARRSFRGRIVPLARRRGALVSAHRDLGVLASPLLLMMLTTGAAMALPQISRPLLHAAAPARPKAAPHAKTAKFDWASAFAMAKSRFPNADLSQADPQRGDEPASIRMKQKAEWRATGRTIVYFNATGRQMTTVVDPRAQPRGVQVFDALYPLHTGTIGGLLLKTLNVLGGLSLSSIALFGAEAYRQEIFR